MAINMPYSPSPSHIITLHSFPDTLNLHLCLYQVDWWDNKCLNRNHHIPIPKQYSLYWNFWINFLFSVNFGLASRDSRSWAAPAAQPAHQWEIAFPLFKYERQILFAENITASFIAIPSNGDVTPCQRFHPEISNPRWNFYRRNRNFFLKKCFAHKPVLIWIQN